MTCLHEGGHVLAVHLTGGTVLRANISLAGDSSVHSTGGLEAAVLCAGYTTVFCWGAVLIRTCERSASTTRPATLFIGSCALVTLLLPQSLGYLGPWVAAAGAGALMLPTAQFRLCGEWTAYAVLCTGLVGMAGDPALSKHADAHQLGKSLGVSTSLVSVAWLMFVLALFTWAYWPRRPQAETMVV